MADDLIYALTESLAWHKEQLDTSNARVKELEGELECARQVTGEECDVCGWAGIRGDLPCAFCAQNAASAEEAITRYSGDTDG